MPLLNRSHTIPYCDIRLEENVVVFRGSPEESSGSLLKGTLAFCITESVPVRSITLSLMGIRRLYWQERTANVSTGNSVGSVKGGSVIFTKKWEFLEFSHKHPVTLRPDNYEYDFDTILPGDLPESIEGLDTAQIFYRLKAVIERPRFSQNITAKKHLRVVRTLNSSALELSQTMSMENIWPEKVEYSICIPNKAVAFGSSIPIDIVMVPLLKGLTVGKVVCQFNELHSFSNPEKGCTKNDLRNVLEKTFENGWIGTEDSEDFGRWRLQDRIQLPKSLIRCIQDCEVEGVKVRHKLKFSIQLHNPDGHTSELRASLPVQLFISPNLLMGEDNVIHGGGEGDLSNQSQAPPCYDDHYLDRLYQGLPQDYYETPMHTPLPSGRNSLDMSRQGSSESIPVHSASDSGKASGSSTPARIPIPGARRGSSDVNGPLASPPSQSGAMAEEVAARLRQRGSREDYFPRPTGSSGHSPHHSRPSTRAHSPVEPHDEEVDLGELSKVPSYSIAVRSGTRNLGSASNLPTYDNGFRNAPASPRNSPPSSFPVMLSGRDGSDRSRTRSVLSRHHSSGAIEPSSGAARRPTHR